MKRQLHLNLFIYGGHHEAASAPSHYSSGRSWRRRKTRWGTAEAFRFSVNEGLGRLFEELEIKMKCRRRRRVGGATLETRLSVEAGSGQRPPGPGGAGARSTGKEEIAMTRLIRAFSLCGLCSRHSQTQTQAQDAIELRIGSSVPKTDQMSVRWTSCRTPGIEIQRQGHHGRVFYQSLGIEHQLLQGAEAGDSLDIGEISTAMPAGTPPPITCSTAVLIKRTKTC